MSELLRQQQRAKEIKERLYGKSRVVNVAFKPKIELVYSSEREIEPEFKPLSPMEMFEKMMDFMPIVYETHKDSDDRQKALEVLRLTCEEIPFDWFDIIAPRRSKSVLPYRQLMQVFIYNNFPSLGMMKIGDIFHRDHTSILNSLNKYRDLVYRNGGHLGKVYNSIINYTDEKMKRVIRFIEPRAEKYGYKLIDFNNRYPKGDLVMVRRKLILEASLKFGTPYKHEMCRVFGISVQAFNWNVRKMMQESINE